MVLGGVIEALHTTAVQWARLGSSRDFYYVTLRSASILDVTAEGRCVRMPVVCSARWTRISDPGSGSRYFPFADVVTSPAGCSVSLIVDSGTSFTYLPTAMHSTIVHTVEAHCKGGLCGGTGNVVSLLQRVLRPGVRVRRRPLVVLTIVVPLVPPHRLQPCPSPRKRSATR